ncbi:MAG: S41 family peptidase [Bdellovibrio sp.]
MNLNYQKFLLDPAISANSPSHISFSQAQEDIEILLEALEKAYPAKWVMSPMQWQNVLFRIKSLQIEENISTELFGTLLADILWKIPDGHLKLRFNGKVLGSEFTKHLRKPSTGSNLADLSVNEFWKIEQRESLCGLIPVIAISGFPQASEPQWNGFSEAINQTLSAPAIIVDLRGNAGGDDTRALEMVSIFLGRELETDWVREIVCETPEAVALQINTYEMII